MRDKIMNDWFNKGEIEKNRDNYFEAFIYLWISWVIGCKIFVSFNVNRDGSEKNYTDRDDILDWCRLNATVVAQIINENHSSLKYLGIRKGERYGNPIVDASRNLSTYFDMLQKYFRNEYQYTRDKDLAKHFGELLNKIRNNLFHGDKTYSEKSDLELIKSVLPVLYAFTKDTIRYSNVI
jgi:hypothetical protein